jgi:hypothetical protein
MGIVIGFLIAEALVRLMLPHNGNILMLNQFIESERGKFARYDRMLGWDGLENAEDDFEWIDARHHVIQNKFGYRGSKHEYQRTGKKRLLFLGDSFVWGFGVENKDIFTSIMEQSYKGNVEVVNMGVSGYGTDQEFLLWGNKGYLWKPDYVVLMVTIMTDFVENLSPSAHGYNKPFFETNKRGELVLSNVPVPPRKGEGQNQTKKFKADRSKWIQKFVIHSAFANLIFNALVKNKSFRHYFEKNGIIPKRLLGYDFEYPLYLKQEYTDLQVIGSGKKINQEYIWTIMFKLIGELKASVAREGGKLVVVIIPSNVQVYPELWEQFLRRPLSPRSIVLDPEAPNRRVHEWCRINNVQVIDLLPGLRKAGESNPYLYYPVNRHWTREGHIVVSDMLLSELNLN